MKSLARNLLTSGCVAALLAVAGGAFGAHALRHTLPPDSMAIYQTAVAYQFYHAVGLLVMGLAANFLPSSRWLAWAGILMGTGILLFSGSLYLIAVTGLRAFGPITPIGGMMLIAGWGLFATAVLASRETESNKSP